MVSYEHLPGSWRLYLLLVPLEVGLLGQADRTARYSPLSIHLHIDFHGRDTPDIRVTADQRANGRSSAVFRASGSAAAWVHDALEWSLSLWQPVIKSLIAVQFTIGTGVLALPWTISLDAGILACTSNDFIHALRGLVSFT